MKKIISLFLALLMMFSVATVAFATGDAAGDTATDAETTIPEGTDLGDLEWILDLPFWTVGPAFKFAKIAFKLVSVYLKVAKVFGLVDKDMGDIALDLIRDLIEQNTKTEEAPADSTVPAAQAA